MVKRLVVLAAVSVAICLAWVRPVGADGSVHTPSPNPPPPLLERFMAPDDMPLVSYRAFRHLTASTRRGRMKASVDAWTTLDPVGGFTFEVVAEEGSSLIRRRVLIAALETEQRTVASAERDQAALTHANYEFFDLDRVQEKLVRIGLRPRRKHMMLVHGAMFVEPESADLVRVEGELSRRPSFWTRQVRISREYARVDGVHVPVSMNSTADVLVVGASTFSMTYRYAEINGRHVD